MTSPATAETATADPADDAAVPRRHRAAAAAPWLLLVTALACYWLPLRTVDAADLAGMGGLGLVAVLPGVTLLGAGLLAVAFGWALAQHRQRRALLTVVLLTTVVSLHAVPAVLESEPRFATAWQHLGFVDHIERTGAAAPDLDARWSWPGFFAVAALAAQACGVTDPTDILRWWPTVLQTLHLAPLALLLRGVRAHWRATWCAAWLFVLCGWVGQDYFSPQSLTYLLYLCFVALLVVFFRAPEEPLERRRCGEAPVPPLGRGQRGVLWGVLVLLFLAALVAHQLTPFVMLGTATALVWARRSVLRGLPLLCGTLLVGWLSYGAEPYWSGHLGELLSGVGGLGGNVSSSVAGRIEGGDPAHTVVLATRIALAGGTLALAGCGVLRRWRAGYADRALVVLTVVPFAGLALQSYGGEMALRVFLFALPGACPLAALALFPHPSGTPPLSRDPLRRPASRAQRRLGKTAHAVLVPCLGLTLLGGFLVARWGNESFERVLPGEVAALEYVYARDLPSARVLWPSSDPGQEVTPAMPWGARDMARVGYEPVPAPVDPRRVDELVAHLRAAGPGSFLMVGHGQARYLWLTAGYPADWEPRLRRALAEHPAVRAVFVHSDAALYTLRDRPPGPVPPAPRLAPGPRVTWDAWSVVGALSALLAVPLLGGRELVRVTARPGRVREEWLTRAFWVALPLVTALLAATLWRVVTLT